jgi:hypothetical protein
MSTVYVVSMTKNLDISQAEDYGALTSVFPSGSQIYGGQSMTEDYVKTARRKLRNFRPDDFILPVGDPLLIGIAFMAAAEASGGEVQMLKWDKRKGDLGGYRVVTTDMQAA